MHYHIIELSHYHIKKAPNGRFLPVKPYLPDDLSTYQSTLLNNIFHW